MRDERRSISRPSGWFCVGWSADLSADGEPRTVHYFDTEMVMYRGESGRVVVFEAYCAHLGAHLGVGGRVRGDDLVCPYHAWRWDSNGEVAEIPYSSRTNRSRRLRQWPVREQDGAIYVWDDERGRDPGWEPPRLEALAPAKDPPTDRRFDHVRMAPLMLVETLLDRARFAYAHDTPLPEPEVTADGPRLRADYGSGAASVTLQSWGTGIVRLTTSTTTLVALAVPVDREHSELRTVLIDTSGSPGGSSGGSSGGEAFPDAVKRRWAQLDQDIAIWEHQRWTRAGTDELDEPEWARIHAWADQFHTASEPADLVETS